jgi:diguanylate cyclase (GGDEF)-like protein
MISLKKHIDAWGRPAPDPALGFYRSLLSAVGKYSYRAVPALGRELEHKLSELDAALQKDPPAALAATDRKVQTEFARWADRAFARHETSERELREIVGAMVKAVESITARDERYALEARGLATRLRSITRLTDLVLIREAVVESANSLAVCVERMAETGRQSLRRLSDQVDDYRSRLSDAERLSAVDPLTGLANRRTFEAQLDVKIQAASHFCLILIDLNGFKKVNDRLGHLAGDDVLKSFAGKLRVLFPGADLVARWGGDEFAVIVGSSLKDARARIDRIRRSAICECKITSAGQVTIVTVEASLGVVEWDGAEKGLELLARADTSMYSMKVGRPILAAADLSGGSFSADKAPASGRYT